MNITDESKFQKNSEILRNHWAEEVDNTMEQVEQLVREDFYTGIWGFLFNKVVALFYSFFLSKEIREEIMRQAEVLLEAGKKFNDNPDEIVEKFFEPYLLHDVAYARAKKNHPKFPELKEKFRRSFLKLVKGTNILLRSEGDDYNALLFNAYPTKEEAQEATFSVIDDAEEDLEFSIQNKMIKINRLIRKPTIRILRKEVEIGRDYYNKKIDDLYGK